MTKLHSDKNTKILIFGKGDIVVGEGLTAYSKIPSITFLKTISGKIGRDLEKVNDSIIGNIIVAFEFNNINSIDVIIHQLKTVKKRFREISIKCQIKHEIKVGLKNVEEICSHCNHSLKDNLHGLDQDDFFYENKSGEYIHNGKCIYCKICNPRENK